MIYRYNMLQKYDKLMEGYNPCEDYNPKKTTHWREVVRVGHSLEFEVVYVACRGGVRVNVRGL